MSRKKEKLVEIDYTEIQKGIRNAKIWMIFNVILLVGGLATLGIPQIGIIAIGVLIFCPISMIKNFRKYRKFKNYLKNLMVDGIKEDKVKQEQESLEFVQNNEKELKKIELDEEQKNNIEQFSKIKFNYESELEAILEFDYGNPTKSVDRLFFGKEKSGKVYSRDYFQTSKNNFVHLKIFPSPKRNVASFEYGGTKTIGDNFEAGYTVSIKLKYPESKLRKYLIDIMNENGFGCLPASSTLHCHLDSKYPNEEEAKEVFEKVISNITGKNLEVKEHDNALTILKKRYAKGEITREEFNEIKEDLKE